MSIFYIAKKITDGFFDGMKKGREERVMKQEKDELERLLSKHTDAK